MFLSTTPLYLLNFSTPNPYPINCSYQLLVTTPNSISSSLLYHLLLQPVVSATISRYCYHTTLSDTPISYLHQLFLSGICITYFHLLYLHTSVRYSYQNSFVTNHYQFLVPNTLLQQPFPKLLQNSSFEKFCTINRKTLVLVSQVTKVAGLKATQMISCEYCEIFKNSFFYRTLLVAASNSYKVPLCHFGAKK